MTHDYSHQSVQEDPRMMAFFDSLVQRDIEGWTSSSDDESDEEEEPHSWYKYFNAIRNGGSQSSSSDESDPESVDDALKVLNPQTYSYIASLRNRIDIHRIEKQAREEAAADGDTDEPSTSRSFVRSVSRRETEDISSETNKISQLINDKKREHLRKVAKVALRCTKKHLKKIRRHCKPRDVTLPSCSAQIEKCDKYQELNSLVDRLNSTVEIDTKDCAEESRTRRSRYKIRRRLRYLTDQSDYILNEVLPGHDSSSSDSSDSDDHLPSDESIIDFLHRSELHDEADSSSDSSGLPTVDSSYSSSSDDELIPKFVAERDSDDELEIALHKNVQTGPMSPKVKLCLKEPDDEELDQEIKKELEQEVKGQDCDTKVETSATSNICTLQSGPFLRLAADEQLSALACLCPSGSTSNTTTCLNCSKSDACGTSNVTSVQFKSNASHSSTSGRNYRKRKHAESSLAMSGQDDQDGNLMDE
jgi:hypothetical protein